MTACCVGSTKLLGPEGRSGKVTGAVSELCPEQLQRSMLGAHRKILEVFLPIQGTSRDAWIVARVSPWLPEARIIFSGHQKGFIVCASASCCFGDPAQHQQCVLSTQLSQAEVMNGIRAPT